LHKGLTRIKVRTSLRNNESVRFSNFNSPKRNDLNKVKQKMLENNIKTA